jgi:hypothetical protein
VAADHYRSDRSIRTDEATIHLTPDERTKPETARYSDAGSPGCFGVRFAAVRVVTGMLRADELTVVHHDDTVSHFTDVTYTMGREGLRVITATGDEKAFPQHDVLTTVALTRPVIPRQLTFPGVARTP